MITLVSFDGTVFADIDWTPIILASEREEWNIEGSETPRTGSTTILGPGAVSPRRTYVDFVYQGTDVVEDAVDQLVGLLNPLNQLPRLLLGTRHDAIEVQRYAKVELASGTQTDESLKELRVVFVSEKPEWTAVDATVETTSGSVSPIELDIENAGQAVVHPVYRIGWTAQHSGVGTVVGQQYRRRMTLENTQDRVLAPFPYRIDLGDTAALTTAKAQADGDDLRIIVNGEDMTRKLIGFDLVQSYAWIVVPGMDAGETLTIDVVYGNASATDPDDWGSILDLTRPVPDLKWETGTATGGTTGELIKAAAGWDDDEWLGGVLLMLTGTLAGQERTVTFNNATTMTWDDAFLATVDSGDTFLISMSRNARWVYAVRQTERGGDHCRGRYNVNSASFTPSDHTFDAPGSWRPTIVKDNRDSYGLRVVPMLTMGGSDRDPFAILDVVRMWNGNDQKVPLPGTADGMALTTPMPMEGLYWEYQIVNQNGMCKLFIGVRTSGAEDWAEVLTDDAATAGSSFEDRIFSPTTLDLTDWEPVHQLVTAMIPVNDEEIPEDWKSDQGSATSGSTNYTEDLSKEWIVDQYADNGWIYMLRGPNAGRKRNITSNTAVRLNHDAFPHANDDGDGYRVSNTPIRGLLRDGTKLWVDLDDSVLVDSGLGTETEVYDCSMTLWVGPGPSADPAGQHRALIGWAGGEKRVFLTADEQIEIDASARSVRIYDTVAEEYGETLTDPAVIVQYHDGTQWRRTADWLPLGLNDQSIWLEETNIGTLTLEVEYHASFLGA